MTTIDDLIRGTKVEPRPYQARIVGKALDLYLSKKLRSILVESPTGSGKTVMGLLIAAGLQRELGLKVGWVAMRRYLLAQAREEAAERGIPVKAEFISMFEKNPPANLDLLVVDEAQHDAAGSMAHLHNVIRPRFILGLSATPFRADKVKLCFDTSIRDAGIRTLIEDGFLSKFRHFTIPTFTPETVADFYLREKERWGKTVFYFHTIPQCERAAALLRAGGARVEVVTANGDRDAQLARFEAGELDALVNCIVLAEGFDCPTLQTVFCRPSEKGITVQMCGRVLRKHASAPVKNIIQCQKSRWPFVRTASAELQYVWEHGEWRSLQVNPKIQQVALRTMRALAQTNVELPAWMVKRTPRR
ncbi:MAG TPA: DEAD/DEAH box helicase family protein, partial [Gemmataceae bacterium]|nr:DEAD/DEAH box helicase family protein [Gemmataceae bacterium]